jgi:hypothetical protein
MKTYKDMGGDSGVIAYDYGDNWMRIQFRHGGTYEYLSSVIGTMHLSEMKRLADSGDGLGTYINTHPDVKKGFSSKS